MPIRLVATLVAMSAATVVFGFVPSRAEPASVLPAPKMSGGMPLMDAIARRQSIRAFAPKPLPLAELSNLLWAANGVNRPLTGDRTTPSWRGGKAIDIFVATAEGVRRYDPLKHHLMPHMTRDIRAEAGRQPFPATAPVVLIYVVDRARMPEAPLADQTLYAHVDAAFVAQNVYLVAASEGLATVVLGNVERDALSKTLGLSSTQVLTFTQPIGYPK